MPVPVKLQDVIDALEITSEFNSYFLDRRTGEIEIITADIWSAAENDELISEYPEWQRDLILKAREILSTDHFVELPSKSDINSYEIMERFCHGYPSQRISEKLSIAIKGKGAFRRFNDMIDDIGLRNEWNRFEHQQLEKIAVDWLEDEGIPFTRGGEIELNAEM